MYPDKAFIDLNDKYEALKQEFIKALDKLCEFADAHKQLKQENDVLKECLIKEVYNEGNYSYDEAEKFVEEFLEHERESD